MKDLMNDNKKQSVIYKIRRQLFFVRILYKRKSGF